MQVLVSNSNKANNFITINVESDKLIFFWIFTHDNLSKRLAPFTDKIHMFVSNSQVCKGKISEFTSLIEHVHSSIETWLNIILDVVGSNSYFVHKTRKLGTWTSCIYRRHYVVVKQTKPNIRCGYCLYFIYSYSTQTSDFFLIDDLIYVDFRKSKTVFSYH